ncbi:MAG: hypothetical protein P8P22_02560 [Porticoccaceae bacterium]|nr:hypothetical protein [Porticoccaceae bacterium]
MFRKIFILKLPFFLILLSLNVNAKDLLLYCDNIKLDYRYDLPNISALDYGSILIEVNDKEIIIKGLNEMFDDSYNQVLDESDLKYQAKRQDTPEKYSIVSIDRFNGNLEIYQRSEKSLFWSFKGICRPSEPIF